MEEVIVICLLAYLAGSVNFAILFFKIAGKGDPRLSFSGNAGTTNVYRQAGMPWAVLVFILDIGRGRWLWRRWPVITSVVNGWPWPVFF